MNKFKIAVLGNLNTAYQPHYMLISCLNDAREMFDYAFDWIATESLIDNHPDLLAAYSGIIAGSGPYKSKEGIINGIRYARENNIPFLGTCSGFGYAMLEFGQWLLNLDKVYHPNEAIDIPEKELLLQPLEFCNAGMHAITFIPLPGTLVHQIYGKADAVTEESHCSYGIHQTMIPLFAENGMVVSGTDAKGECKIMEYHKNIFFIVTLFLPQLKSNRSNLPPLIVAFLYSAQSRFINHSNTLNQI